MIHVVKGIHLRVPGRKRSQSFIIVRDQFGAGVWAASGVSLGPKVRGQPVVKKYDKVHLTT